MARCVCCFVNAKARIYPSKTSETQEKLLIAKLNLSITHTFMTKFPLTISQIYIQISSLMLFSSFLSFCLVLSLFLLLLSLFMLQVIHWMQQGASKQAAKLKES